MYRDTHIYTILTRASELVSGQNTKSRRYGGTAEELRSGSDVVGGTNMNQTKSNCVVSRNTILSGRMPERINERYLEKRY